MKTLVDLMAVVTPYSSIVGTGVTLLDSNGRPYAIVNLIGTTPDKEYKDWAPVIAAELADLINKNSELGNEDR